VAAGVQVPITPGIMPITNYSGLARFSKMCGAEIPLWIAKRLSRLGRAEDRESIAGLWRGGGQRLCRRLLEGGAPGMHLYTLNRARASLAICRNLGLGQLSETA
jgi:methylenetetrahydrofolate reductase (NADPH)